MRQTLDLIDLPVFAEKFLDKAPVYDDKATIVGLYGDLGAGKTAFTKEVANLLDVEGDVSSPTFVLQSNYKTVSDKFEKLVHIDLYRIESQKELNILNLSELFKSPRTLIFIEWMEKIEENMKDKFIKINFEHLENEKRDVKVKW